MEWRPSQFNSFCTSFVDGITLAFNSLSGELLALDEPTFARLSRVLDAVTTHTIVAPGDQGTFDDLRRRGFVVAADFDERAEVRRRYHEGRARTSGLSLTIAPTVACNFGCSYCFQEHPNRRMGDAEIAAVQRYIERELAANSSLGVVWFGGEPLIAFPVIERLAPWMAALCAERSCRFTQSMITNGWLLTEEKIAFLSGLGSMRMVQVTVDGPAAAHDRRRVTTGGGATFTRVLDNVTRAALSLNIALRVNIDRTNCGFLEALLDELEERGLRGRVTVYLGHTTPYTDVCAGVAETALTREQFAEIEAGFRFHLLQRGWSSGAAVPRPGVGGLCVADHPGGQGPGPGRSDVPLLERGGDGRGARQRTARPGRERRRVEPGDGSQPRRVARVQPVRPPAVPDLPRPAAVSRRLPLGGEKAVRVRPRPLYDPAVEPARHASGGPPRTGAAKEHRRSERGERAALPVSAAPWCPTAVNGSSPSERKPDSPMPTSQIISAHQLAHGPRLRSIHRVFASDSGRSAPSADRRQDPGDAGAGIMSNRTASAVRSSLLPCRATSCCISSKKRSNPAG